LKIVWRGEIVGRKELFVVGELDFGNLGWQDNTKNLEKNWLAGELEED
jgi:hypothetical protein